MEPITFVISITHRDDGRFDAFCENMPETIVSGDSHEEVANKAVDAMRAHINELARNESELDVSELEFLNDASNIAQKHKGNRDAWLPLEFDEEGVHLGEPTGTPQAVAVQFATSSRTIPGRPSSTVVRELTALAGRS